MIRRYWLIALVVAVVAAGGATWTHLAAAAGEKPAVAAAGGGPSEIVPEANPIVSVVVGTSETEYEQDPFEQTRLRRSTTRVKSLVYVRADGRVETKQVQ